MVFVHIAFRPNRSDLPSGSALFASFFDAGDAFHEGSAGTEIELPVHAEDVVILRRRASAFAGMDLDLVLRARAIDAIAVAGVATGAIVVATCYDAADRGYFVTVLRDGCADGDAAVHDFFMDKVFPSRARDVVSCADRGRAPHPLTFIDERPAFARERTSIAHERPPLVSERPPFAHERRAFVRDRHALAHEHVTLVRDSWTLARERHTFANERDTLAHERASFDGERPRIAHERPRFIRASP